MRTVFRKLYDAWMKFAHVLGWINGRIILTVLYVLVIGPYAIIRMIGAAFSRGPAPQTYWIEKPYEKPTLETMRRIF